MALIISKDVGHTKKAKEPNLLSKSVFLSQRPSEVKASLFPHQTTLSEDFESITSLMKENLPTCVVVVSKTD